MNIRWLLLVWSDVGVGVVARGGFCMPDLATADGYILTVLETKGQNRRCQQTMAGVAGYESLTHRSGQTRQGWCSHV